MKKATQQQTKEHNRNLVLKTILERESISRADVARVTHLTRTTVSDLVGELMAEGLVEAVGRGVSQGGKNPILLSIVPDARYLIGVDLAHKQFRAAIVNLCGELRQFSSAPAEGRDGQQALNLVYELLDPLVAEAGSALVGIGIGTPGLVNAQEGIVLNAVNLDWRDMPLASLLQERYASPVFVLNDSQAAALGEYTFGRDHEQDRNLIVISARHGIGAGIVIDGMLFHGDGGGAGEIGHVVVVPEGGELCRCGNRGCLETVASAQAIVRQAQARGIAPARQPQATEASLPALASVEQAFSAGDPIVGQIVLEAGRYLGRAISGLVGLLNIQKIVLTGDMTCFGQPWLEAIRETMLQTSLFSLAKNTTVEIGQLDENGIILGASALLMSNYALLFSHA